MRSRWCPRRRRRWRRAAGRIRTPSTTLPRRRSPDSVDATIGVAGTPRAPSTCAAWRATGATSMGARRPTPGPGGSGAERAGPWSR